MNEIITSGEGMLDNTQEYFEVNQIQSYQTRNEMICKVADELIAAVKDDRMNMKRVISADIASDARVQNQNAQVIQACERELRRKDLSDASRDHILGIMSDVAKSTSYESASSRNFQDKQLSYSHRLPWRIIGISVLLAISGAGSVALVRHAA